MITTLKKKKALVPKKTGALTKKTLTAFRTSVFSRHPSHSLLRRDLPLLPFRSVVRLGSTTPSLPGKIECNTIEGVRNSSSKLLMKQCFMRGRVKTADWLEGRNTNVNQIIEELGLPVIAKSLYGSRGEGNSKLNTRAELESWVRGKTLSNYIFERFYTYSREYRLHITDEGCFYTNRKLVRSDAPEGTWQRHDDVCSWILETNPSFKKPANWNLIVEDCIRAKNALGLDICAFDVMVQGSKDGVERRNPEWIICESCSAPSFGTVTAQKYLAEIPKVLRRKHERRNNR